jgi:hypothetical protein
VDIKKTYSRPALVAHGSVSEMTEGVKYTISPSDGWVLGDDHDDDGQPDDLGYLS